MPHLKHWYLVEFTSYVLHEINTWYFRDNYLAMLVMLGEYIDSGTEVW